MVTSYIRALKQQRRGRGINLLEKDMGLFLVQLSQTFPGMAPYLKGFYNTINSWRLAFRAQQRWLDILDVRVEELFRN